MREVVLFLVLVVWNNRPEIRIERDRYKDHQSCVAALRIQNFEENKKYLMREDGFFNRRETPGLTFYDYGYGLTRMGYYTCR